MSNLSQTTLNSEPTSDNHAVTKSYIDSLSENNSSRRDSATKLNDPDSAWKYQANKHRYYYEW